MGASGTINRRQSFEPDHQYVKVAEKNTKEVWKCDGSCGQTNCQSKKFFYK